MLLTAALVLPMDGQPPIRDGAVLIAGERIVAVGPRATLITPEIAAAHERRDFGDAVIMPGLVNAHIHLEYTHLGPLQEPREFFPWIRGLVQWSTERTPDNWYQSALDGARQSLAGGITALGEIVSREAGLEAMIATGLHGVAYLEFIGGRGEFLEADLARFEERIAAAYPKSIVEGRRLGLSPHAPYSLGHGAIGALARRASASGFPLTMHLAESPFEVAMVRDGTGALAEFLRTADPNGPPREPYRAGGYRLSPTAYVAERELFSGAPTLLVHCVHLDHDDIALIAAHDAAIVLCPRSNDLLLCGDAPVGQLLDAGITLAVGTDSLGSNRDLDLFVELRALAALLRRQRPDLPAGELARRLLAIATTEGACALASGDQFGSLAPGKLADIAVLALPSAASAPDPYLALLDEATAGAVCCTLLAGRVVYESEVR